VDEESGLVRQAEVTSANVRDFCLAEMLIVSLSRARRNACHLRFVVMNMKRALVLVEQN
jgi:hypothetical protein